MASVDNAAPFFNRGQGVSCIKLIGNTWSKQLCTLQSLFNED